MFLLGLFIAMLVVAKLILNRTSIFNDTGEGVAITLNIVGGLGLLIVSMCLMFNPPVVKTHIAKVEVVQEMIDNSSGVERLIYIREAIVLNETTASYRVENTYFLLTDFIPDEIDETPYITW